MNRKKSGTAKASGQGQGRNDPHSRAGSISGHMGGSGRKDGSRRQEIGTRVIPKAHRCGPQSHLAAGRARSQWMGYLKPQLE